MDERAVGMRLAEQPFLATRPERQGDVRQDGEIRRFHAQPGDGRFGCRAFAGVGQGGMQGSLGFRAEILPASAVSSGGGYRFAMASAPSSMRKRSVWSGQT